MSDVLPGTKGKKKNKNDKFDKLVGPTDPKIDAIARDRLIGARIGLLLRQAFFGNLATRMKLINADEWCSTAATDGRNFYYNSRFVQLLKNSELEFLVGHEVLHVVYDHIERRGNRDPQLFNIANDYAVNADLKRHKVGSFIKSVPCLYDQKFDGKSSEEIYDILYENAEKINLNDLIDQMIDEHMAGEGDGDSDGDGDETDGNPNGNSKRPKPLTAEEREELRKEMREAILNAAKADPGSTPAGVQRMVKEWTNPVLPWRELINQNIMSTVKSDYSWLRPSRRGWDMDAVMPGMKPDEEIDVTVFLDLSGSITEKMARQQISEVAGMLNQFAGWRLNIATFDTEVYNYQTFTSENMDSIEDYKIHGGGGTDFTCIFKYLRNNALEPMRLIVFTDGYPFGSWGDPDYCETTWIIHGSKDIEPPFGTWAYYDEHEELAA